MTELAALLGRSGGDVRLRTARVMSVSGHDLTVDLGGGVSVKSIDSCNPVPDQTVLLALFGTSWLAIGIVGGAYRQSTLTVTADNGSTAQGLVNGVSTAVPKTSSAAVTVGDVLPLLWSHDGARVWAITKEQEVTVAPAAASPSGASTQVGGGRSTSASSVPVQGVAYYSPTRTWTYDNQAGRWLSAVTVIPKVRHGAFFYGLNRFQELQGRQILSCLVFISGGSTRSFYRHNLSSPSGSPSLTSLGVKYASGWVDLGAAAGSALVSAGTGGVYVNSGGSDISGGRLQIAWKI